MNIKKGFTLIELVVAMAIFMFVISAALTVFISVIKNQKRVLAEHELLNEISYAQEFMSKALRAARAATYSDTDLDCMGNQGYIYMLTGDAISEKEAGIKFINQSAKDAGGNPICEEFYWNSNDDRLYVVKNGDDSIPLTSENIKIKKAVFSLNGDGLDIAKSMDGTQPRVTILLEVEVPGNQDIAPRIIQTTVSQRNLNIPI